MNRKKLAMLSIALVCVLTITLGVAFPTPMARAVAAPLTYYVRTNEDIRTTAALDGLTWATAFADLQDALDAAKAARDDGTPYVVIWVAAGTYTPSWDYDLTNDLTGVTQDQLKHFRLLNNVAIYGGFPAGGGDWEDRDWETNQTILSGNIDVEGDSDCLHVFYHPEGWGLDQTAVLDGFIVSGGKTTLIANKNHDAGGGMCNYSSSPAISNVIFQDCFARWGAGMYNENSSPVLTNVTFQFNEGFHGVGMCNLSSNPILSGAVFANNTAGPDYGCDGGGMYNQDSSPVLSDVTFIGNTASSMGGGMYNFNSHPILTDVTFEHNSGHGGGGMMNHVGSNPILDGVDFVSNDAGGRQGGGMWNDCSNPQLTDVTFVGNTAAQGGGMYSYGSTPELTDVLFENNSAYSEVETDACGGGMHNNNSNAILTNVVFEGNSADNGGGMHNDESSPILSDVEFTGNTACSGYTQDSDYSVVGFGGGMGNESSRPVLNGVTFADNSAVFGGGMSNNYSYPSLTDVDFLANNAEYLGGGVYNALQNSIVPTLLEASVSEIQTIEFTDVLFEENYAEYGGAMLNDHYGPSVSIKGATFRHNYAYGGGAIANASDLLVDKSVFEENSTLDEGFCFGGAIYQAYGTLSIANTRFNGNEASVGGAVSVGGFEVGAESQSMPGVLSTESDEDGDITIVNSVFSRNFAQLSGGGIYSNYYIDLINSTFSANHAGGAGGALCSENSGALVANCIFWANTASELCPQIRSMESEVSIYNSLIEGAYPDGWDTGLGTDQGGNIDADPLFQRNPSSGDEVTDYGDLSLRAGSPARDRGDNDFIDIAVDIVGNSRVSNRTVDMGAYEYQVAPPPPPAPVGPVLERLGGVDRFETAVEVSKAGWESSSTVFLARSDDFADALAGVPLAFREDSPILLTTSQALPAVTKAEIQRLETKEVIILGGNDAVSHAVEQELEDMDLTVERVAGVNRFATAAAIAALVAPDGSSEIALANGYVFADALSVAAYAARRGMPILLTNTETLPAETRTAISGLNVETALVVGGTNVITNQSLAGIDDYLRISGADRYATAIALDNHFTPVTNRIFVATGLKFPDCLTGAVLAAKEGCGLILLNGDIPDVVADYLAGKNVYKYTVLGGTAAISEELAEELIR